MLFPFETTLAGDHVRLATASVGYAASILQSWEESGVRDSWHHTRPRSLEEERTYIVDIGESPTDHLFLVWRKDDGRLLGTCGLHEFHGHVLSVRIGFNIFCEDPCLGSCIEEAVILLRMAAYERLGLRVVYAHVLPDDAATKARLSAIGFIPATGPMPCKGRKGRTRTCIYMEHQNPQLLG